MKISRWKMDAMRNSKILNELWDGRRWRWDGSESGWEERGSEGFARIDSLHADSTESYFLR